ncbi:hypothetical protein ABIC16_003158 [Sphingomonas sp. PvP055]
MNLDSSKSAIVTDGASARAAKRANAAIIERL